MITIIYGYILYKYISFMKRTNIQISKELRIKTLIPILEGKELDHIAVDLCITVKSLKYRLTQIYKYYGVKNRTQLMALYIKVPTPFYKFAQNKLEPKKVVTSKVTHRNAQERFLLPIGIENNS